MFMLFFYTCTPLENKKHAWKNKTKICNPIRFILNVLFLVYYTYLLDLIFGQILGNIQQPGQTFSTSRYLGLMLLFDKVNSHFNMIKQETALACIHPNLRGSNRPRWSILSI